MQPDHSSMWRYLQAWNALQRVNAGAFMQDLVCEFPRILIPRVAPHGSVDEG